MKIYQVFIYVSLYGCITSETNGFHVQQSTPSAKWAFAQSYSWVVSNYGNSYDPLTHQQSQEQAQMQQQTQRQRQAQIQQQAETLQLARMQQDAQMQQQALQQQALQQQVLQQQALQQQALQQQALQQQEIQQQQARQAQIQEAIRRQTLEQQARQSQIRQVLQQQQALRGALQQQQAIENLSLQRQDQVLPSDKYFSAQSNPIRVYPVSPNESNGRDLSNIQIGKVLNSDSRKTEYTQEFIDEIVRKVIQETRGEFTQPTTREDIDEIVRKILHENSSNIRDPNVNSNRMNILDNRHVLNNNHYDGFSITPTEQLNNPRAECIFNCGNSYRDGQPSIAVARANTLYSLNRSTDPRMIANSFSYTNV